LFNRLGVWLNMLQTDPLQFLIYMLYLTGSVLVALTFHEVAHGYVAYRCGDPTAKMMGRLTLNPLKHMDPLGTICMFVLGFGWAKPVPVNPRNYGNFRRDDFLVSVAGIATNLTMFILSTALAVGLNRLLWDPEVIAYYGPKEFLSSSGLFFNALLGGQGALLEDFMRTPWLQYVQRFLLLFGMVNLGLGIFNLLPIPPLDGFHIFNDILFGGRIRLTHQTFRMAQMVLMFLALSGALSSIVFGITGAIEDGVLTAFLRLAGAL
jgi:Zn-dependent protease